MRNCLNISQLQGVQGVQRLSCVGWGATLKNFFAYFSVSESYIIFFEFWKMVKNGIFSAEKRKVRNILIFNKFG